MFFTIEGTGLRVPGHPLHLSSCDSSRSRPRAAALGEHSEALRAEFLDT
jgi:hypothetical protein